MSSAPALGIDFGTTNSSMAWLDDTGEAEVILSAEGEAKAPSVVFFDEAEILVGKAAMNRLQDEGDDPEVALRVVRSIKRNLVHPPILSLPGGRDVRPAEVVGAVLFKLKRDAEEGHFREPVKKVGVTHPAEFDAAQKDVLREAALREAGFEEVELISEPVAAALAFSRMDRKSGNGIVIYDLGGGTFDVAVISRQENGSYWIPVPPDGDSRCGGDDFDQALYDHCDRLARKDLGRSVNAAEGVFNLAFFEQCRSRKENLSLQDRSTFSTMLPDGTRFKHTIERTNFEQMIRGRIEGTVRRTMGMVKAAQAQGIEIDALVLISGSSRIPLVRREIEVALSVTPLTWSVQDVAVALGAACCTRREASFQSSVVSTPSLPLPEASLLPSVDVSPSFSRLPTPSEIREALAKFLPHADLFVAPTIPPAKLRSALQTCRVPLAETPLGLVDSTVFGSAKNAMIFGADGIYYHNDWTSIKPGPGNVPYADFSEITFSASPHPQGEEVCLGSQDRWFQTAGGMVKKHKLVEILDVLKALIVSWRNQ